MDSRERPAMLTGPSTSDAGDRSSRTRRGRSASRRSRRTSRNRTVHTPRWNRTCSRGRSDARSGACGEKSANGPRRTRAPVGHPAREASRHTVSAALHHATRLQSRSDHDRSSAPRSDQAWLRWNLVRATWPEPMAEAEREEEFSGARRRPKRHRRSHVDPRRPAPPSPRPSSFGRGFVAFDAGRPIIGAIYPPVDRPEPSPA